MCNCRINSDPTTGEPEALLDQAKYFPDTQRPIVAVDVCIAGTIERLWAAGIRTRACCCGHNNAIPICPNVTLDKASDAEAAQKLLQEDGRAWWISIYSGP